MPKRGRRGAALWVLRGLIAIGFGIALFEVRETEMVRLERLFAAALVLDGSAAALTARRGWPVILEVASDAAAALFVAGVPEIPLFMIAAAAAPWAILAGAARVWASGRGAWRGLATAGAFTILWGAMTPWRAPAGVAAWARWFGIYTILFGAMLLLAALDASAKSGSGAA